MTTKAGHISADAADAHDHAGALAAAVLAAPLRERYGDPDSIPAGTATRETLTVGASVSGAVSPETDRDWFRITLTAGKTYAFTLEGSGATELIDPYLYLYSGAGTQIKFDDDSGPGLTSRITFTPTTSGTYYLAAAAYQANNIDNVGQYTLAAKDTDNAPVYSLQQIADYLTNGFWDGNGRHFSTSEITFNLTGLAASVQPLARLALQAWADVCNITFRETTGTANITFDDGKDGAFAQASGNSATINIGADWIADYGTAIDGYTFQTFLHEIGHALGLGHAGPYNGSAEYGVDNDYANDTWQYTVMSYFPQPDFNGASYRFVMTPQLADIVAVQDLYGAATTSRTGDTIYGFHSNAGQLFSFANYKTAPALTIFDSGGIDTLDCSGYSGAQLINLQPGSFSSIGGLTGNIAIATTTLIETAIGGSGNDRISGNSAANTLQGLAGDDTYVINQLRDRVLESVSQGNDTVMASITYALAAGQEIETLATTSAVATVNINLYGNPFGQALIGNAGPNVLNGGGGIDHMTGFAGNDNYYVDSASDVVIEALGGGVDRIHAATSYVLAAGTQVEYLTTTARAGTVAINLTGNEFANSLRGNAGSNVLAGGSGRDTLAGFEGQDAFLFSSALGAANIDTIVDFSVPQDTIRLDDAFFTTLSNGGLAAGAFRIGTAAADANDRVIYNAATGALIYDFNGSASGGAIPFARLSTGLALTHTDFLVV